MRKRHAHPRASGAVISIVALLLVTVPVAAGGRALAAGFPDVSNEPTDIQAAIDYAAGAGYMNGAADGKFYPDEPIGRMDCAKALVKMFKHTSEVPDKGITFTDIKDGDSDFLYANLAVKHGYLGTMSDGSFSPNLPVTTMSVLTGLVKGLELEEQVNYIKNWFPDAPAYTGYSIIALDLHLKFKSTKAWPHDPYPRGEMAFSLQKADKLEDWRDDYIRGTFDWQHCQSPWTGPSREKAMDSAFEKIGVPYVWGGESDSEKGYDCSGLVYYVLRSVLGYKMQRVADDQARDDRYPSVNRKELLAGDPIFFYESPTGDPAAYIGHAGIYIGQGMFIHSTGSNAGVSVDELTGYWEEHFAWGKRVIPEPEPETFDTYVLLSNPADTAASARLSYMLPSGKTFEVNQELAARSRVTVKVDDTLVNQEVSTTVEATKGQVVAERSMYFRYRGLYPGGHVSPGVTTPAKEWYLAEGCTAGGFDTYVLVQNPGSAAAQVTLTFMRSDGRSVEVRGTVQPSARYTVWVDSVAGMEQADFSTKVTSDQPVVVERSMYFDYHGTKEGSNSTGVTTLLKEWYFAEGYTGQSFDTYMLIANTSDSRADVTLTLLGGDSLKADFAYSVSPHSRLTVPVDNIKGWEDREFSAAVRSPSVPIAVERSMYFSYNGVSGGHDSAGGTPATSWYLAEGYTGQGFDTYILLANPGAQSADVAVRFLLGGGRYVDRTYRVPAASRYTIAVDREPGLSSEEVSTSIISTQPIVAERSMYFRYGQISGGSCAPAVSGSAMKWHFAEGYTGR